MPYVVAITLALAGLVIIQDALYFMDEYGLENMSLEWLLTVLLGIALVSLGWFIFRQTLSNTYTVRKR